MRCGDRLCARLGLLAVVVILGLSCTTVGTGGSEPTVSADLRTGLQRRSLETIFASGGTQPPPPDPAERAELRSLSRSSPKSELRELKGYVHDRDLRLLAARDTDADGVHDYRISDYYGKFMEGDIDVDGDGIRNSLDAAPYDATAGGADDSGDGAPDRDFADRDSDGIPDHVDWSGAADDQAARWQEELFREHGVLMVGRSADFSPEFARSARDAVARIFRKPFEGGDLPTLRVIATDETCLLSEELDDATNAMVVPQTQSLLVYRVGLDYPPIAQLGLLAHELAHSWQFSLDFDETDLATENRRVYGPATEFHELVEPFGWTAGRVDYDPTVDDYGLFTPQYHSVGSPYLYRGDPPEDWAERLAELYEELGDGYLEDASLRGVVGDYSLTNPWEWHADNLLAYLYVSLEARATQTLGPEEARAMVETLRAIAQTAWPGFRYRNFDHELLGDHYRRYFPLEEADLDYFVESYLRPATVARSDGDPAE